MLTIEHLRAEHRGGHDTVVAADDISFSIGRGHCTALVGESGSGKTTIARTVAGLHPIAAGRVLLAGQPLAGDARRRSREQRSRIQLIFQDPRDALNPRQTVRQAIGRPIRLLRGLPGRETDAEVDRLFDLVRLPRALEVAYPAELSGGEAQRVGIARALAAKPDIVICDEVTSALDVSVQAAVLELLRDLRSDLGVALLFITHDLGVVAAVADTVVVLRHGRVCETGPAEAILRAPAHDYTKTLLESAPSVSRALESWESAAG